jgi:low affinity Fe/Cu permease
MKTSRVFKIAANNITKAAGSLTVFIIALSIILIWGITGPIFNYSNTWQLIINSITNISTFLMVFIIQQSQNKDTMAMQLKINELIATSKVASNRLLNIEDLTDEELGALKQFYIKLATLAQKEMDIRTSHTIEEAEDIHHEKYNPRRNDVVD